MSAEMQECRDCGKRFPRSEDADRCPECVRGNMDAAMRAVAAMRECWGTPLAYEDYESALTDTLADLMHACERYEMDFEKALASARMHYMAERAGFVSCPECGERPVDPAVTGRDGRSVCDFCREGIES